MYKCDYDKESKVGKRPQKKAKNTRIYGVKARELIRQAMIDYLGLDLNPWHPSSSSCLDDSLRGIHTEEICVDIGCTSCQRYRAEEHHKRSCDRGRTDMQGLVCDRLAGVSQVGGWYGWS